MNKLCFKDHGENYKCREIVSRESNANEEK